MPLTTTKSSSTKSKTPPKITSRMTTPRVSQRSTSATLMNIPDDILTVLYKNLNISQLMIMYRLNTSFSTKKGAMIDVETLDLTNVRIDATVLKFIDNNINKLKIKKLILDNIFFADDEVFNAFIVDLRIRKYINVEEIVISNFDSVKEGKYVDPYGETVNYFCRLIDSVGGFTNLKKLSITYTNIITETDWDENEILTDTFIDMLRELENLNHLIIDYNNIEPTDLQAITKEVRKINKKRRKMKIPEIKPYERSNNNTFVI